MKRSKNSNKMFSVYLASPLRDAANSVVKLSSNSNPTNLDKIRVRVTKIKL